MCSGCQTVTRELATSAYFSVCLRRSLVTRVSSEVSACVGDSLTPPTNVNVILNSLTSIIETKITDAKDLKEPINKDQTMLNEGRP